MRYLCCRHHSRHFVPIETIDEGLRLAADDIETGDAIPEAIINNDGRIVHMGESLIAAASARLRSPRRRVTKQAHFSEPYG